MQTEREKERERKKRRQNVFLNMTFLYDIHSIVVTQFQFRLFLNES